MSEILVQDPIQSTSESAAGEGRNDQDEVESHNVNKEHKGKEEAKKPVDKRPMGDVKKPRKKSIIKQPVVEKGPLDDLLNTVDRP